MSQATELEPGNPQARFKLGVALQAAGRHAEALQRFEAAQASLGDDPLPFLHGAVSHLALGEAARAKQAFAAAIQLSPRWADAWVNCGLARYRQVAVEDAKTAMRQALAAEPGCAAAIANLAAFMRVTGEAEAAGSSGRASRGCPKPSERGSIWRPISCRRSARRKH